MGESGQNAYATWQSFHRWADITTDVQPGIVVYLRSLTPIPQDGTSNFGGGGHGGGGHHDGGGGGGGKPPADDAGTTTAEDAGQ